MKQVAHVILAGFLFVLLISCGQSSPTWQEQYDLGVRYLEGGNYEEAIIAFTAAIEIDPKQAPAYVGRGDAYIGSGETEENLAAALADYEKAVELDETCAEGYLGIADVYIRQGEFDKALEILKTGLEKTGNDQSIADKIAEMEEGNITDSSGNVRRVNNYDADGNLIYYFEYTYNEIGQESSVTSFDGSGNKTGNVDFQYDSDGNQIVGAWIDGVLSDEAIVLPVNYMYDEAGNLIKEVWSESRTTGMSAQTFLYYYDEKGREQRYECYQEDQLIGERTMEYDRSGNLVKENDYDGQGELYSYLIHEYNSAGEEIKYASYSANGDLEWYFVYSYNEQGEPLKSDYYQDGKLIRSEVYR